MVRLVGPADLRETLALGFHLTFTNGVADEDVSQELANHLIQIIPGLKEETVSLPEPTSPVAEEASV